LLIDSRIDHQLHEVGEGCFLSAQALRSTRVRPRALWVGAGVHNLDDLQHAAALGCDFALIEEADAAEVSTAAKDTLSRWETIAALCRESPLPVYVGLEPSVENLRQARRHGAHGLAVELPA